jgi:hypothetical protein
MASSPVDFFTDPGHVIPLGSRPNATELIEAIEVALGDQGMAVV